MCDTIVLELFNIRTNELSFFTFSNFAKQNNFFEKFDACLFF